MDKKSLFFELLDLAAPFCKNRDEKVRMKVGTVVGEVVGQYCSEVFICESDVRDYLVLMQEQVKDLYMITVATG